MTSPEVKAAENRLPRYAKAAVKRMRRDARAASAANDARWARHTDNLRIRQELTADVARAESRLRDMAAQYGHHANWQELKKKPETAVASAREALADHMAEMDQHEADKNTPTESQWAEKAEDFLAEHAGAVFVEAVAELPPGDAQENLESLRAEIIELVEAEEAVDRAPIPLTDCMSQLDRQLDRLAQKGAPDIFSITRMTRQPNNRRAQGQVDFASVYDGFDTSKPDAFHTLLWVLRDTIREKLEPEIAARIERTGMEPIAAADREPRKAALRAKVLDLSRIEEALVASLQTKGFPVVRRHDAPILAVLGVATNGTLGKTPHSGAGSLAHAAPPVDGVTDLTRGEWTNGDPTPSRAIKR